MSDKPVRVGRRGFLAGLLVAPLASRELLAAEGVAAASPAPRAAPAWGRLAAEVEEGGRTFRLDAPIEGLRAGDWLLVADTTEVHHVSFVDGDLVVVEDRSRGALAGSWVKRLWGRAP